jgi:hypothetical protein
MRAPLRGLSLLALASFLLAPAAHAQAPGEAPPPPVPGGPAARAVFTIKAEKGFIDDPFAVSTQAQALAVLLTDAASFARIDLIDLKTGKPRRTVELGDPQRLFERIYFADDRGGLVLISRDAGSGRRSAQYFDDKGKAAGLLGPMAELGVSKRGGEPSLIAVARASGAAGDTFTVSRHRLAGLGRLGKARSLVIKNGEVQQPPLKAASWLDSNSMLVGLAPGGYDKARDLRVPDQSAVYDVLTGALLTKTDVGDVVAWAAAAELRRKFPGRGLFAIVSPDTRLFELVDWQGRRGPLELPVPLRYYDPTTLVELEDPATPSLFFSLAIDPLHPEALARRKKDPSYLDLYWARPAAAKAGAAPNREPLAPTVTRLLRAPIDDRPTSWAAAGGHAAVLRKHKNFSRGGALLELYQLEKSVPE